MGFNRIIFQLFASIFSLAGIIIMSYVDGFLWDNPALTGILLAVGAAVGSAMYKVSGVITGVDTKLHQNIAYLLRAFLN